ncbi:MAG: DUF998 domain-containing protein [Thermoplasmata archaeon]|nr:DUF998 domain-containing protein [Thermoplasmata archaeon]MCI4358819.1 DUF998 domain-containing protein [Thermoplasmata archaeon]
MGIAQKGYPGFSDVSNAISDLGNSTKSPWFLVFNVAIVVFGFIGLGASWLLRAAFRPKTSAHIGVALLGAAFVGAIGVGLFPEQVQHGLHAAFSALAFVASGIALLTLSLSMLRDTRWEGMRLYTALSGAVALIAIALLFSSLTTSSDFGAVERVIVAPVLLWFAVAGIHLWRMPVYDPVALGEAGAG